MGAYVFRLWRTGIGADDKSRQRANQFLTFSKKLLTNRLPCDIITARCMAVDSHAMLHGGIAQLGERLNGIQEVRGSTPLISTSIGSGLLSVDKSSDLCLYRIRRPYFPEDLPLPIARFRLLLGNLYAKKFSDFSGNPLLFCRMCAIILALHRGIAQLVEYRSPKPWVAGSNPPAPAKKKPQALPVAFSWQEARETKGTAKMVYSCAITGAIKMKKMPHEL